MTFLLRSMAGKSFAQDKDLLDDLCLSMGNSCVETAYTYTTVVSGLKITGDHKLEIQDGLWHMRGSGLEIWCDGKTVWTTDPQAKEVVMEDASSGDSGLLTNPALLLMRLKDWFDIKEKRDLQKDNAVLYILEPKPSMKVGIDFFNIEISKADGKIRSGSFALSDGNAVRLTFSSMSKGPKKPVSYFRPAQSFDSSWIVTDLR